MRNFRSNFKKSSILLRKVHAKIEDHEIPLESKQTYYVHKRLKLAN